MDWTDYVTALQTMLQMQDTAGEANLNGILPRVIDDAELRLFRDPRLDFLATRTTDTSTQTVVGVRTVTTPAQFIVVEDVALITPTNAKPNAVGSTRIPLLRVTRAFIDATWTNTAQTQAPTPFQTYWSLFTEEEATSAIEIAPTPDAAYVVEFRGTFRPTAFYTVAGFNSVTGVAATPTAVTFLSTYLPDLFLAASLVFSYGYMKNFGAASEDPRTALSWEAHLESLMTGASIEEYRKKCQGFNATSFPPSPFAMAGGGGGAHPPMPAGRAA